jgi:hypothetical protein
MSEPTVKELAASLLTESVRWVRKGFPIAEAEVVESRLQICNGCEHWNPRGYGGTGKCTVCGCSTKVKLVLGTSKCPIDKW